VIFGLLAQIDREIAFSFQKDCNVTVTYERFDNL
jgi:hypothetical protein